jgi:hypothetical protein
MKYVCDATPYTWFRIETAAEAAVESQAMDHAVERYFRQAEAEAALSYQPPRELMAHEQNIGRKAHIQRAMPIFVTLRDNEGKALVTAMLPPEGRENDRFRPIIVGHANADPFPEYGEAIEALGHHFDLPLEASRCYPYRRG